MEQAKHAGFNQSAMRYGTYLGIAWAIMYIALFNGVTSLSLTTIAMGILLASPFIAGSYAIRFRQTEYNNSISYRQAWRFLFYMYICATLLSALTNYIYLNYIDKGAFLMQIQSASIAAAGETGTTIELFSGYTTGNLTWIFLSNNILCSLINPLIIAFFVKRKK